MLRLKQKSSQNQTEKASMGTLSCHGGFTLIELTVVMALIGIMFFVTLPRIKNDIFVDQTKKTSRWLLTSVRYLKEASIRDQADHTLHVDMDNGKLWVSHALKTGEMIEKAETGGLTLADGIRILDVAFAGARKVTSGVAQIQFHAEGYSDSAMIHMVNENDRELSYQIPPFLPQLKIIEDYVDLEE